MDLNIIFSAVMAVVAVVTAVVAVISLIFSGKQIKLSNKQNLFNRRLTNYLEIENLINSYEKRKDSLNKLSKDEAISTCDMLFSQMTQDIGLDISDDDIKNIKYGSSDMKILSELKKIERLKKEADFIYKKGIDDNLGNFIIAYRDFLEELLYYQRKLAYTKRKDDELNYNFDTPDYNYEKALKNAGEPEQREKVFQFIKKLNETYSVIESKNVMGELSKEIKL